MSHWFELIHRIARIFLFFILGSGLFIALLFIGVLGWFRWLGVPDALQNKLKNEFERRSLILTYEKLYLDGQGDFVVKEVRLFSAKSLQIPLVEMNQLNLEVEWIAWWRGTPFLQGIGIDNADLQLPLSQEQKLFLHQVEAQISFQPQEIDIQTFQARFLNTKIFVQGEFPINHFAKSSNQSFFGEELIKKFSQIETLSREIVSERPIEFHIKLEKDINHLPRYEVQMEGRELNWRKLQFQKLTGNFIIDSARFQIPSFILERNGEALRLKALVEWSKQEGWIVVDSKLNPVFLTHFLSKPWQEKLIDLKFETPPLTQAEVRFSWRDQLQYKIISDIDWRGITCQGSRLDRLQIPIAFEKNRLFIPEAVLEAKQNSLKTKLIYEKESSRLEGEIKGQWDPTDLKGFLPKTLEPFLNSCRFKEAFNLALMLKGTSFQKGDWNVEGDISVRDAFYKDVSLPSLVTRIKTDLRSLTLEDVILKRKEGEGKASYVNYTFDSKVIQLRAATSQLHVQETAHLFGGNFEKYCEPYRFEKAPYVRIEEGTIDLGGGEKTQLLVQVEGGRMTYPFLGALMPFERVKTKLAFEGLTLKIFDFESRIYQGNLTGRADFNFTNPRASFEGQAQAENMEFGEVMENFFQVTNVSGTLNGSCSVQGEIDNLISLKGSGEATVEEGYLMSIPFLGGLSDVLNTVVPSFGYAKAKEARTTFTIDQGFVSTDDFQMSSLAFSLIGNGNYNFVQDNLDMDARINIKGPVGIVLFPVSKLFEYHGTGPLSNPVWAPKVLGR